MKEFKMTISFTVTITIIIILTIIMTSSLLQTAPRVWRKPRFVKGLQHFECLSTIFLTLVNTQIAIKLLFLLSDVDDCKSNPCKNNGTCTDLINDFECVCPSPWKGKTCNSSKNIPWGYPLGNVLRVFFYNSLQWCVNVL